MVVGGLLSWASKEFFDYFRWELLLFVFGLDLPIRLVFTINALSARFVHVSFIKNCF